MFILDDTAVFIRVPPGWMTRRPMPAPPILRQAALKALLVRNDGNFPAAAWDLGSGEELNSGLAARSSWETVMIKQFKVFISQQGQALSIALLAFLFGGALLLGLI
jgi:hypothetical protein